MYHIGFQIANQFYQLRLNVIANTKYNTTHMKLLYQTNITNLYELLNQ